MFNIVTWNINGIRSSHQQNLKELFDSLDADILCLQETKITRDMLDEATALVDGYTSYYSFSRKRAGYSGVATYCKMSCTPYQAEEGLTGTFNANTDHIDNYDNVHSSFTDDELHDLDAEGRCVMTLHKFKEEDVEVSFVIFNVYCPNAGENDERLPYKLQFYKALQLRCLDMFNKGYRVIVLGDLNISHRLIDHCEPEDIANFPKKPSRVWLDEFLVEGGGNFIDSFRHLFPTKEKSFTCWNTKLNARVNNYGTRIDYILLSSKLLPVLRDSVIMSDVYGSDHCPVKATLDLNVLPSAKYPSLCTKNFKGFQGKQLKMSSFVCKRSLSVEVSSGESEPKKAKLALTSKATKPQQSSLLKFFTPKPFNSQEIVPSSDLNSVANREDSIDKESDAIVDKNISTAGNCSSSSTAVLWKSVFKGPPPPPVCAGHQEICVLRTVRKKGPNLNRQFWACSRAGGHSNDPNCNCNFFVWASAKR